MIIKGGKRGGGKGTLAPLGYWSQEKKGRIGHRQTTLTFIDEKLQVYVLKWSVL